MMIIRTVIRKFKTANIYDEIGDDQQDDSKLRIQLYATRLYIISLAIIWSGISLYTATSKINYFQKEIRPTIEHYMELEQKYPATLICSCENSAIQYHKFLSIDPIHHEVNPK